MCNSMALTVTLNADILPKDRFEDLQLVIQGRALLKEISTFQSVEQEISEEERRATAEKRDETQRSV